MSFGDISLTGAMRANLSSLQTVANLQGRTQQRLATGKKVNSALDNPTNYFTAQGEMNRASDISNLKDGMSEGIQTIKAASTGISQITALIATARGIAQQALASATGGGSTTYNLTLSGVKAGDAITVGGSVFTAVAGAASATQFSVGANDSMTAVNLAAAINAGNEGVAISATKVAGNTLTLARDAGTSMVGSDVTTSSSDFTSVAQAGSTDRGNFANQFNTLMSQISALASTSGYKGVNLLQSSNLSVSFEKSTLTVSGFDGTAGLNGYTAANNWSADTDINAATTKLDAATASLRQQSSTLASNLSIITVNQDFSTSMMQVLQDGADNLTNADTNEEGANMLMLQTRQSLGTSALSLSAQAAQAITKLF